MAVEFAVEDTLGASWDRSRIGALVRSLIEPELRRADYRVSLHLVSDETIRALNQEHRGKDAHTDVLSFPLHDPNGMRFVLPPGEPVNLGDVVVSYPRAVEQASQFGHSVDRELGYLVAHGVLHLLGYDHEEDAERRVMRRKEEEALAPLGFTR
ncbi:MAG TPA: rRNA maturation RNase YbeY [Chloroflexota bacterium]|nr:rRNA maturation RNase YbeY [Chloroflexota bacterium]